MRRRWTRQHGRRPPRLLWSRAGRKMAFRAAWYSRSPPLRGHLAPRQCGTNRALPDIETPGPSLIRRCAMPHPLRHALHDAAARALVQGTAPAARSSSSAPRWDNRSAAGQPQAVLIPALGEHRGGCPAGRNLSAVGEKLAGVVEEHHSVAEQAPALFWVSGHGAGGITVGSSGHRTRGNVKTRRRPGTG